MVLRAAPNAIVMGSTTAGADGNISAVPLSGALQTFISGLGVFYLDKRPTQRIGIVPDIAVRPTIAGVRAGRARTRTCDQLDRRKGSCLTVRHEPRVRSHRVLPCRSY
jgi:C-terminal processing protease CtpA/Prc